MKLKFSHKLFSRILIISLLILNAGLLFYFLKSPEIDQLKSTGETNWQEQNYPEILQIKGSNWDFQKLTQFFKNLAGQKGGEYAYHALAVSAQRGYLPSNVDTHLLGHAVGDMLYEQKGIDGIKVCTDDLRNACSHSIVVGFLLDNGETSLPKAVSVCHDAPGGRGAYTMCVHGLGHGVLGYAEYDMRRAVMLCKQTGTKEYGNQEIGQCIGGVTMEMMAGVHDKELWQKQKPNYFKDNDPLAPCSSGFIPKEYVNFCYAYLTPHLLESAGMNLGSVDPNYFKEAMSFCEKLPKSGNDRKVCLGSFGKEYVVFANARNVQSVENMSNEKLKLIYDWCNLGPEDALSPCIDSALQSLYWGGENDPGVSIKFCGIIPNKKYKDECMNNLIRAVSYYLGNDNIYKASFCGAILKEYQEECQARLSVKIQTTSGTDNLSTQETIAEQKRWSKMMDEIGPDKAYEKFKKEYENKSAGTQHLAAHIVGTLLYEKAGLEGLAICDNTFSFGCYHSFFSQVLAEKGPSAITKLDQMCVEKFGRLGSGCQHGIGHGVMDFYGPGRLLLALDSCKDTTVISEIAGCTSGVFMEYNVPIIIDEISAKSIPRSIDPKTPYEPCPDLPQKFQASCYYSIGQWWSQTDTFSHDWKVHGELCKNIPNPSYLEVCFLGIGNIIAPQNNFDPAKAIAACKEMPDQESIIICQAGASWSFDATTQYKHLADKICDQLYDADKKKCEIKAHLVNPSNQ